MTNLILNNSEFLESMKEERNNFIRNRIDFDK